MYTFIVDLVTRSVLNIAGEIQRTRNYRYYYYF